MAYETLKTETRGRVGHHHAQPARGAQRAEFGADGELRDALAKFDADDKIGAIVITGSEKAFAAGADIKEMQSHDYDRRLSSDDFFDGWNEVAATRKPVIAAVAGYALGGGCELAMMCDFIIAADTAKFGQPEITLGVHAGHGRHPAADPRVGKAKAMDLCLTGRMMDAEEAERSGLVARVVPADELLDEASRRPRRSPASRCRR